MYGRDVQRRALVLIEEGRSLRSVSMSTGVSRSTLRYWRDHPEAQNRHAACPRCDTENPGLPEPARDYAYLLGLYLGDGYINPMGDRRKGVWILRITCADAWPGPQEECKSAIRALRPGKKVATLQREGCTDVLAWSKHWPCLFPQHGGKKHERKIELAHWQRVITDSQAAALARGLFHSDGCRFVNRVRRPLSDGDRWYEYPRYMFTNESADILRLCGDPLDLLEVAWCFSRRNTISVARKEAVARLDEFVGPKY